MCHSMFVKGDKKILDFTGLIIISEFLIEYIIFNVPKKVMGKSVDKMYPTNQT